MPSYQVYPSATPEPIAMDPELGATGLSDCFPYFIATQGPIGTAPLELDPTGPSDCHLHTIAPYWNVVSVSNISWLPYAPNK